jgi:hypothetical protein
VCACVLLLLFLSPLPHGSKLCTIFIVDVYTMVCVTIQYYDEASDLLYLNIFLFYYVLNSEHIYMDFIIEHIYKIILISFFRILKK